MTYTQNFSSLPDKQIEVPRHIHVLALSGRKNVPFVVSMVYVPFSEFQNWQVLR